MCSKFEISKFIMNILNLNTSEFWYFSKNYINELQKEIYIYFKI